MMDTESVNSLELSKQQIISRRHVLYAVIAGMSLVIVLQMIVIISMVTTQYGCLYKDEGLSSNTVSQISVDIYII